jgi:DNA primase
MAVIDEIKQKIDIVEVIGQYVKLTKSGRTLRAPCPFHSEKKPSFFVYPDQQTWHCFGACNTGGDVFSFIMKKEGVDFSDALRLLAEKTGVAIPSRLNTAAEDSNREKLFQINLSAAQYYSNLLLSLPAAEKARNYLKSRGLNDSSLANFQLGYSLPGWESLKQYLIGKGFIESEIIEAGLIIRADETGKTHDRFRDHIMFPIMDDRGRITGFGARVLDPNSSGPKYTNSPQTRIFDKSGSLYGFHLAKSNIRQQNLAVLVEGYMDVIIAHQYGFSNVVAPMGVAITEKQISQLKKLTHSLALALDPDTAGEEAAMRCVEYENSLDAELRVISLPGGKDPDEVIKEDPQNWKTQVEKSIPVIEYTIRVITARLDLKSIQGKTEAVNKILPIIAQVKAGTRQYQYLTKLALAINIDEKKLEAALGRFRVDRRAYESKTQAIQKATRTIRSNAIEEYILAILLRHPEIREMSGSILPEYFENSENRDIFEKWLKSEGVTFDKESLDPALQEHFESLISRTLPDDGIEKKCSDCVIRLREKFLRNLMTKQAEELALEAETGDSSSVLSKLAEIGTRNNEELKEIFETGVGYKADMISESKNKHNKES